MWGLLLSIRTYKLLALLMIIWKIAASVSFLHLFSYLELALNFALIVFMIVIDMVQLFFKGSDGAQAVIRNVFGLVVCGIVGMAASAGVWYLKYKKGKGTGENE